MNVVIMGCGRVGARLALSLDRAGHNVTVLDIDAYAFRRLTPEFRGTAIVGNGIDEDALRRAGIEQADAFAAVTQGDNRNIMAAQVAKYVFNVPKVTLRIYDPIREELYHSLGLDTVGPTSTIAGIMEGKLTQ
ncbi:MAG: TrkA family potassium uptake protein [Chloroflexota bacterium]|nr:MAG: TrkA family potassium uptake protein [Chloroflexota bacterium]